MKIVSYASQIERAINIIKSKNADFDSYSYMVKHNQVFQLVRLSYTNKKNISPDKFDMNAHYTSDGFLIPCVCKSMTEEMADRISIEIAHSSLFKKG